MRQYQENSKDHVKLVPIKIGRDKDRKEGGKTETLLQESVTRVKKEILFH